MRPKCAACLMGRMRLGGTVRSADTQTMTAATRSAMSEGIGRSAVKVVVMGVVRVEGDVGSAMTSAAEFGLGFI